VVVLFKYVSPSEDRSTSMMPTTREGSVHLIHARLWALEDPGGGSSPSDQRRSGDEQTGRRTPETIAIRDDIVEIDGQPLEETYVFGGRTAPATWNCSAPSTPGRGILSHRGQRSMSQDQHEFGAVDARRIVGKVVW
jgi:hypothetical protein